MPITLIRSSIVCALLLLSASTASLAQPNAAQQSDGCGEVVTIETHDRSTTRYALVTPSRASAQGAPLALVLLVGGGGYLDIDDAGCPDALKGNSLVRSRRLFNDAGFITALVDAPSGALGCLHMIITSRYLTNMNMIERKYVKGREATLNVPFNVPQHPCIAFFCALIENG